MTLRPSSPADTSLEPQHARPLNASPDFHPTVYPLRLESGLDIDTLSLWRRTELGPVLYDIFCESYGDLDRDTVCGEIVFRPGATLHLIRDAADTIVGFGTILIRDVPVAGRVHGVLHSGVYFRRGVRGGGRLWTRLGARVALKENLKQPLRPFYSMCELLSPVSYRRIARDFPSTFPSRHGDTSARLTGLLSTLVAETGLEHPTDHPFVVVYPDPASHTEPERMVVSDTLRADPDVQYYLAQNPHFAAGHILCALIPLNLRDLARACWRQLSAPARKG